MENQFDNDSNKLSEIITLLSQLVSNNELFNQKQDTVKRLQVSSQNKLNQVNERLNSINQVNERLNSINQVSERLNSLREYNIRSAVNIRDNFELVDEKITNLGLELKKILDEVQALKATSSDSTLDKVDKKISKFTLYLNELSTNVNDIKNLEQNEFGALKKEFSQIKQSIQNNSNVIDDSPIFQNKDMSYIRVSPLSIHYNNFFLEPNLVFSKESCLVGISTGIDINETNKNVGFHFSSSLELTKDKLSVCMKNGPQFYSKSLGFAGSRYSKIYIEKRIYKNTEKITSNTFLTFQTSVQKNFPSLQKGFVNFYSAADLKLSLSLKNEAETTNCEKVTNNVLIGNEEPVFKSNIVNTVDS